MVLSLMACALIASGVSKLLSRPLYATLAQFQLDRLPEKPALVAPKVAAGAPTTPTSTSD